MCCLNGVLKRLAECSWLARWMDPFYSNTKYSHLVLFLHFCRRSVNWIYLWNYCLTVVLGVSGVAVYQSRQQRSGGNPCSGAPCNDQCVASFVSFTDYKCMWQRGVQVSNIR